MTTIDPTDQVLLGHLGTLAAAVDPPPPQLFDLGREAFSMHTIDAELIRLLDVGATDLVGVRAAGSPSRLLSFEGSTLAVELQLTVAAGRVSLVGQVIPPPPLRGVVRVQAADGAVWSSDVDELGTFSVTGLPETLLRLHFEPQGEVAATTTWIRP